MRLIVVLSCFLISFFVKAQYGNEWIDYAQNYYSLKIAEDGIYKIDYNTLVASGVPVSTISSANFQLFGFEKEQAIYIEDGGDNSIDNGDYILFYGQKNNTWLDSLLYEDPNDIANKYFPHYNDTITYFLTWNNQTTNSRMIEETDVNTSAYPENPYFLKTNAVFFDDYYAEGFKISGLSYSEFVNGEGWASGFINALSNNSFINSNINTSYPYIQAGAPDVIGRAVSSGVSNAAYTGSGNHHLQVQNATLNTILRDTIFTGYQKNDLSFSFPSNNIISNTTNIRHEFVNDLGAASDYQVVHYTELTYPRLPNLGADNYMEMTILNGSAGKSHYAFTNFNAPTPLAFALGDQIRKIPVTVISGAFHTIVPNTSSGQQNFIILDEGQINDITTLKPVNGNGLFTNYTTTDFNNAYIIISHPELWSGATAYQDYRESPAGGGYNVILADVTELNLQFGGGVPKHIMGLRRFQHFAYHQSTTVPNHVFLLGKGIREANEGAASGGGMRINIGAYAQCLVPTYGYPASDALITANLEGNVLEPLIPIGRLAATNSDEVMAYLNKVEAYELNQNQNSIYTIPTKLWQKEILHFGGGSNASEQNLFKAYLISYENLLEDARFGGNVHSYYKTVSDPINPVSLSEVNDRINSGVSFMTFFGHASATGFDQNVDDPANWNNEGKYPMVVGNSCLTGNIHEPLVHSASESFILIEDKGAIAFLANVKQGFPQSLNTFSHQLFSQISESDYGTSIGQQMKMVCNNLSINGSSFSIATVLSQMTLHGDPALKPNFHNKPEIAIESPGFFITPDNVDLTVDSIDVNIVLYNLGQSVTDTFTVELKRFFPNNGGDSLYTVHVNGLDYIDTLSITIPLYVNLGVGINKFEVKVDIPGVVEEQYDEINNNQLTKQFIFNIDGIYPVWPYDFAIVPDDTITLKASTVNPFADLNTYRFEIDTTDLFNSPFLKHHTTTSLGGVIEVQSDEWLTNANQSTSLSFEDSTVYFWRVTIDDPGNYNWQEFSFQHINGKRGWGQDHFFQFKKNDFDFLNYDRDNRQLEFNPASKTIHCQTYGNASNNIGFFGTLWEIDGQLQDYAYCNTNPKLLVAVIDPVTLVPWATRGLTDGVVVNTDHNFGNSNDHDGYNNCRARPELFFAFEQDSSSQLLAFENMILNEIPDSFYVLIYTARRLYYSEWDAHSPQLYSLFQGLGSDSIAQGKPDVPYIGFYKKGDLSSYKERYGLFLNEYIELDDTLWGFDYSGFETSTLIGPGTDWQTLYWQQYALEQSSSDTTRLRLYGKVTNNSTSTLLLDTLYSSNDSIINLNTIPGINNFTLLQLQAFTIDDESFTPAQIDSWHVTYTPVPEAALTSVEGYYLSNDSILEGEDLVVSFDIKNISDLPMDSILINYWIEKDNHQLLPIPYERQDSLRVGQTIEDTITVNSLGLSNYNSLWVEVNPYDAVGAKDQPEMYHFNNIGQIPFQVANDDKNPILEVSFDNQFILNGDLVSPTSEVVISLKDDNPLLLLDEEEDTALFGIYLTDPFGNQKKLNFRNSAGEQLMDWIPANSSTKKFKIIYNADFENDGTYRLLVQGADKSGNISGDYEYDIEFEIDHNSSITNLMNYPNPFSTQTQFVFTLTGATIPDEFTIQILTVSGKLVRTITIDELGPIHIGRNVTEFRWDGRDEFGDQLANGVYLYRVITSINGESIDHRSSGADQYITKGFGKMYLIR